MVDNGSDNLVHQVVLAGETALTVYHDKSVKHKRNISNSMSPAFTVDDLDAERERVLAMDAHGTLLGHEVCLESSRRDLVIKPAGF